MSEGGVTSELGRVIRKLWEPGGCELENQLRERGTGRVNWESAEWVN